MKSIKLILHSFVFAHVDRRIRLDSAFQNRYTVCVHAHFFSLNRLLFLHVVSKENIDFYIASKFKILVPLTTLPHTQTHTQSAPERARV